MNNRVIAITGFMAAGKTAVGSELAARLSSQFIDLDDEIVRRESHSIADLIGTRGETYFRAAEIEALKSALEKLSAGGVIALGGGTWTILENRKLLRDRGAYIIWLDTPFDVCWKRIQASDAVRPLARARDVAERLFRERQDAYQLADNRVAGSDNKSVSDAAREIAAVILQSNPQV